MKLRHAICALSAGLAFLSNHCSASLNGSDDFNDNSKDTNRWGADIVVSGIGAFTETNQRLEYTTSSTPTPTDIIVLPWVQSSGSYTQNWEVQIDVSVPSLAFTNASQQVFLGLVAFAGSVNNRLLIEFGQGTSREFRAFYATNGVRLQNIDVPTATISSAVRLSFDAGSKVLSCFYDDSGMNCGYSWTLLRAEEVGTAWGLSNTSAISIAVIGDSSLSTLVSSSNVYADNFRASSGDHPTLRINLAGSKAVLSWATNGPTSHLESTSTLSPPICWQAVTNAPGIVTTNFAITNSILSKSTFYRLSR
jgi:hypothetical protein